MRWIVPARAAASGTVTKCLNKHSVDAVQKTAVLVTSHIIREVLQCETGRLSGGDRRSFKGTSARQNSPLTGD